MSDAMEKAQDATKQEQNAVFHIGLTMAGAISAGAYTAGVMDFLVQALEEWSNTPKGAEPGRRHDVRIVTMSGASAGAITAGIGTVALAEEVPEAPQPVTTERGETVQVLLRRLYTAWVEMPRMVARKDGAPDLLFCGDGATYTSVLNCWVLDDILKYATSDVTVGKRKDYVADGLDCYFMTTNLRGVPYDVTFTGQKADGTSYIASYGMMCHGDRVHYKISGIGTKPFSSAWASFDHTIDLNAGLPGGTLRDPAAWERFALSSLASGAFPIGLEARQLDIPFQHYFIRAWPMLADPIKYAQIQPNFRTLASASQVPATPYPFVVVDGGVINNEPFEYARYTLMEKPPLGNKRNKSDADRAVIMIDPFPEPPNFNENDPLDRSILSIATTLFPVLKNQVRFKPEELLLAADEEIYSRFLIVPKRTAPDKAPLPPGEPNGAEVTIACGLLGGFGGFIDEAFRVHDFQLGRRNCQQFLRTTFVLPGNNAIMGGGESGATMYPIIPLCGSANEDVPFPHWPRMRLEDFGILETRIAKRVDFVVSSILKEKLTGRLLNWGARLLWNVLARRQVSKYATLSVLADLIRRDQIDGWSDIADKNERAVLVALADPRFELRTASALDKELKLGGPDKAAQILDKLTRAKGKPYQVWKSTVTDDDGASTYTLMRRKDTVRDIPVIGAAYNWVFKPTIG